MASCARPSTTPTTDVSGRLRPQLIQTRLRENYGLFRRCYEDGLMRNAQLEGKVTVRFVIGLDGRVTNASQSPETTLPDPAVVDCIVKTYLTIEFPQPEGGIVTVVYPIMFAPG